MNKMFLISCIVMFCVISLKAQTLSAVQQQNARATGYAIVASRNPGKSFSIYMIKWDGVNDLEYNANNQINPGWHPQAAIKGNYFDQTFEGSDFSNYSSVVVSQADFDTYKSTGTDWWIVCSTLPSYSNSSLSVSDNGNVGIGTTLPSQKLTVDTKQGGSNAGVPVNVGNAQKGIMRLQVDGNSWGEVLDFGMNVLPSYAWLQATNRGNLSVNYNLSLNPNGGNVGIGTTTPSSKLTVAGNIASREVKVAVDAGADFVFEKDYNLPSLDSVDKFIKENKHLPEISSAKEMQKDGINLSEMNIKLLQKIEELTLYVIEMKKQNEVMQNANDLMKKNQIEFEKRLLKIENK